MKQKRQSLILNINFTTWLLGHGAEERGGKSTANLLSRKRASVQGRKWRAQTQTGTYANFHQKRSKKKFSFKFIYCDCTNAG